MAGPECACNDDGACSCEHIVGISEAETSITHYVLVDVDSKSLEVPYDGIPDFNEKKVREMSPSAKQMDMTVLQL